MRASAPTKGWGMQEQGRAAPTCHCEPARTLARQSVLLVHVTTHPVGRGGIRADVVDIGPYGGAGDTGIRADEDIGPYGGVGDTGRCGQKVNCPAGARGATLGCRPLRFI